MLCDSNIVIYAAAPGDTKCNSYVRRLDACISSISRIEVLGYPGFDAQEAETKTRLVDLVESLPEISLGEAIINRAIALRRERNMRLGDSIIAATALTQQVPLVTRNVGDFKHIAGLEVINPFAEEQPPSPG
jgi:toxin FitB